MLQLTIALGRLKTTSWLEQSGHFTLKNAARGARAGSGPGASSFMSTLGLPKIELARPEGGGLQRVLALLATVLEVDTANGLGPTLRLGSGKPSVPPLGPAETALAPGKFTGLAFLSLFHLVHRVLLAPGAERGDLLRIVHSSSVEDLGDVFRSIEGAPDLLAKPPPAPSRRPSEIRSRAGGGRCGDWDFPKLINAKPCHPPKIVP
jgi:hypothetical protein